jgi:hypothetical protein
VGVTGYFTDGGGFSDVALQCRLERLLRDCARPAFALERLHQIDPEHLVDESAKPGPSGSVGPVLPPL